jgi:NodT family efflux transporter outer membrane factor (OMF) lipoprotein
MSIFALLTRPAVNSACLALCLGLSACSAVGPDFAKPGVAAPEDWSSWRGGDEALRAHVALNTTPLPERWWESFNDPVLNQLAQEAQQASPDLQTAALHFVQARLQRGNVEPQDGPNIGFSTSVGRQRQSEWGAGTRLIDAISPAGRDTLVKILSEPFTLYQAGFDASWEPDLWGRVRRAVEAADADVTRQAALLDLARLSVTSEVVRNYLELRTTQRQLILLREDETALQQRLNILQARVQGGVLDHLDLERQRTELVALQAQRPPLFAQEAASTNQLTLLLGQKPGGLRAVLAQAAPQPHQLISPLPDLSLGVPSEVALRRPDIRSAEAQLHRATANIGVARADLYPTVRLGAKFGVESYRDDKFFDLASRSWSIVPSLDLPLFDQGRRQRVVQLRELEQQEAAITFQRTVLQAWQEIDDALNGYAAEQQQGQALGQRANIAREAYQLAQARYDGGVSDFTTVIDAQRAYLQARRDLVSNQGRQSVRYVMVNKSLGNTSSNDVTDTATQMKSTQVGSAP